MREMRREGFRVRLELQKITDTVEDAVEKAERCASDVKTAQEHVMAVKDDVLQKTQRRLEGARTRDDTVLQTVNKKLITMEKMLDEYKQSSINEEFLMTQLMELQEHYESELTMIRKDYDAVLKVQQKKMEKLEKVVNQMQEEKKELKPLEKMARTWRDENKRLMQQMMQLANQPKVDSLQILVESLEDEIHEQKRRTRVDLNNFENKLVEIERNIEETATRVTVGQRSLRDGVSPVVASTPALSKPFESSPSLPRDLVRQGELAAISDEIRRINQDFQAVGMDMSSLAKRIGAERSQQDQRVDAKLRELSTQFFDALSHGSRLHASEITRLKSTVYDVQRSQAEGNNRVRQVEGNTQQASAAQAPIRSPRGSGVRDGWSYQQSHPQALQTPLPQAAYGNHRTRPSRYEPAYGFSENQALRREPTHQDGLIRTSRRESHRSRSPVRPRRYPWESSNDNSSSRNSEWAARNDDRRYQNYDVRGHASTPSSQLLVFSEGTGENDRSDGVEDNQEVLETRPFRRTRRPRSKPELIIIDEDDDENENDGAQESNVPAPMISAPPDIVLDKEGVSEAVAHPAAAIIDTGNTTDLGTSDLLQKESDLQMGFLLYFCLGGAPNLDVQWTPCFTHLKSNECVEMPRALRFQRQYTFLQSLPVYLTQCILQAVILSGQSAPDQTNTEVSEVCGALSTCDIQTKFDKVVKDIHLSWASSLFEHIKEQVSEMEGGALDMLKLSVNPAGLSSDADKDDIIYEWSRRQASIWWRVAQNFHNGSLLPVMNCNADVSPSVYLFTLTFDVMSASSGCPQLGTFRLNDFGSKLIAHLWNSTLKKLPYVFLLTGRGLINSCQRERSPRWLSVTFWQVFYCGIVRLIIVA
ncbi:hypothetical protein PsorP6_006310 [Peronosclerospora sorghi]|uniref:Uncharacterized protein n=1 Tax=Peronosclerospora sorghi TaxID=230839 RepID=A0ACC0W7S3_9STRA|nr:hypothetical protein PsorP6_006310 [Peronosclerospora sorghi]